MKIVFNDGTERIVYPCFEEDDKGVFFLTGDLNHFSGLNSHVWQVLRSAAGYYIGCLTCSNYAKEGEEPNWQYEPKMRDSDCYWKTREEAEEAIITRNYPVKF